MSGEKIVALRATADRERGRLAYEICQGCHRPDGSGRSDGSYPQLASQHATVLIKQMVDVREGSRDNPKMFPFAAKHAITTQEVADIAAYLESLKLPADNGRGPGTNLERGMALYKKDCATCHGDRGQGDARKFYPVLAGQHYLYLTRQAKEIRDGKRRNANTKMVKVIKRYVDEDIDAVSDYMSRLTLVPSKTGG